MQVRALPRAPPARLLDQPRELGARLVVAAAAGEPVGQRQSERLVLRHETDSLLQHGDRAFEQAETPVDLRDLGRAREHERGVVAVIATVGQHTRQRLPGLRASVEVRQHRAQLIGAREFAERALERRDRPVALLGRHVGARQPGRDLVACVAFGHRQAPIEPFGRRDRLAGPERQAPERVERVGLRVQSDRVLPRGHRAARVRERALDEARCVRPQGRRRHGLAVLFQDPRLVLEDVRELGLAALADEDVRQLAQRGGVPRPFAQAGAQHVGRAAPLFEQPAQADDLEAQREPAFLIRAALQLGGPQGDAVGEAALGLVQACQRLARDLVLGRLLVEQPPDPDGASAVVERAFGQLGGAPQPAPAPLIGHAQAGAVEEQRGGDADRVGRPRGDVHANGLVDRMASGVGGAQLAARARVARQQVAGVRVEPAEQIDRERVVAQGLERDLRRLVQEVQVVGLLGGQAGQRVDQPAIGVAALQVGAAQQGGEVARIRRERAFERALGRIRVLRVLDEGRRGARVQIAAGERVERRGVDGVFQRAERGADLAGLDRERFVEGQQRGVARVGRRVRVDEQAGGVGQPLQPHQRPQQAAPRFQPFRRQRQGRARSSRSRRRDRRCAPRAAGRAARAGARA